MKLKQVFGFSAGSKIKQVKESGSHLRPTRFTADGNADRKRRFVVLGFLYYRGYIRDI